jgi:hypothetical protein
MPELKEKEEDYLEYEKKALKKEKNHLRNERRRLKLVPPIHTFSKVFGHNSIEARSGP